MGPTRILQVLQCLSVAAVLASAASAGAGPPANDDCANALAIGDGVFSGTTIGASNDGPGSCGSSVETADVWYHYTAPASGLMTAELCASEYDTVLSLWSDCPDGSGEELACNDNFCGLQSSLIRAVQAGENYRIRVSGWFGSTGPYTLDVSTMTECAGLGPDVVYNDVTAVHNWGAVGGVRAYSLGSSTCNAGDANLQWGSAGPLLAMNAYRLHEGRLVQVGMSFVKNGTAAASLPGCGPCNDEGGFVLGAGCLDIYGSGFNGLQSILGPRSSVNAFTGQYPGPTPATGDAIFKRLQIAESDLVVPGAMFFVEGQYVAFDDAFCGNAFNNASYRRVVVGAAPDFNIVPVGDMQVGVTALQAWQDHGNGVGVPDPSVEIAAIDVPGEGRFHLGSKVSDLGGGVYRYEYALRNLNSHRSAGGFSVPLAGVAAARISNTGFHDVDYHSGEPYDNADWRLQVTASSVRWSSPQTFAENPETNALRFGTMYSFWFDAAAPPVPGVVTVDLFRPGTPSSVTAPAPVPSAGCPQDLDGDGEVAVGDLVDLITTWGPCAGCPADFDGDGEVDVGDLVSLITSWGPCQGL